MKGMPRAPRVVIAVLLLAVLAAAHGSGSLLAPAAGDVGRDRCCCPSIDACRCTANCCNHDPIGGSTSPADGDESPSLRSSVSCRFPRLPNGSLSASTGHEIAPGIVARGVRGLALPDLAGCPTDLVVAPRHDNLYSASSPRAPPAPQWVRC